MPALAELQRKFAAALLSDDEENFTRHLAEGELPPSRQLAIYRTNVVGGLTDALTMAYPVVHKLVGGEFFEYLADDFIRRTPSRSGNLHHYGREWPEFLRLHPKVADMAYLPDVARLEWACHEVFFAADHPPLESSRLARIPQEQYEHLKFHLHPATRDVSSPYPIHRIWMSNQDGFSGDPVVDLNLGGVTLLVHRQAYQPALKVLTGPEWAFLDALRKGTGLLAASNAALELDSQYDVSAALQNFVVEAIIVDFSL